MDALTEEGVEIIIALTHVGLPADIRIAEAVTGHRRDRWAAIPTATSARTIPDRDGPYPTFHSRTPTA